MGEGVVICSNCQTENATGTKFCKEWGTGLGLACATCGNALLPDAKFCGECGTPVSPAATPGSGAVAASTRTAAPSAPVAERRIVSVLFADLVGFTTLAEGRDAEDTRDLLSRYFDISRDVIGRYGGALAHIVRLAVARRRSRPLGHVGCGGQSAAGAPAQC